MKKRIIIGCSVVLVLAIAFSFIPLFDGSAGAVNALAEEETGLLTITDTGAKPNVTAVRSVLIEAESGQVLFGNREKERAGMASTTKIMTALVVLRSMPLDTVYTIPKAATGIEGSSIYLVEGEQLTIEELLYGLMLRSGNDCAVALALACSGSVEAFVKKMNQTATELGITDTHFVNPHGLFDDNHYTSALSLARITAEALKNDTFRKIVSTKRANISYNNVPRGRSLTNNNRLLNSYEGCIGVKTGFTDETGRCLVSAAERDGVRLIAVTLNDHSDWNSHKEMLNYGFTQLERVMLAEKGILKVSVPVTGGYTEFVKAENDTEASVVLRKGTAFTGKLIIPKFLYAPVKVGDIVGYAEFYDSSGTLFYRLPLKATENVEFRKLTLFEKIFGAK
jgi:D-alanyl-D-alanine carboxypeptidase (penicillin-binding protein 5/6)